MNILTVFILTFVGLTVHASSETLQDFLANMSTREQETLIKQVAKNNGGVLPIEFVQELARANQPSAKVVNNKPPVHSAFRPQQPYKAQGQPSFNAQQLFRTQGQPDLSALQSIVPSAQLSQEELKMLSTYVTQLRRERDEKLNRYVAPGLMAPGQRE